MVGSSGDVQLGVNVQLREHQKWNTNNFESFLYTEPLTRISCGFVLRSKMWAVT